MGPAGEKYEVFDSEKEANAYAIEQRNRIEHRTIGEAVTSYLDMMKQGGARPGSLATTGHRLVAMLRLKDGDRLLRSLTPPVAERLYRMRSREVQTETHRGELAVASRFAAWCVGQAWLTVDPFAAVVPVGERSRGKRQLRVDEARKLLGVLLAEDSIASTAVMLALLSGLRASEVTERVVRDLDNGGRLLWIDDTATAKVKTKAGHRQIEIAELLQPRLGELVKGKGPAEKIFGGFTRHALYWQVRRFCRIAGVPEVCPHGLRGLFATVMIQSSGIHEVARVMGHAGTGVTRDHYLQPGAEQSARGKVVAELLTGEEHPIEQLKSEPIQVETTSPKPYPTAETGLWN